MNNTSHQRTWYRKQKNRGVVYLLTIGTDTYVGSTTNSLKKRLWQHKAKDSKLRKLGYKPGHMQIKLLERLNDVTRLKEREQYWIEEIKPTINSNRATPPARLFSGVYKGGVTFEGKSYPTKIALWKALGSVPLGTFKTRLFRFPLNLKYALGLENSPNKSN